MAYQQSTLRILLPSVRANEVGSLKHEVGSEVGSVVDIDRRTTTNSHLCVLCVLCARNELKIDNGKLTMEN